jgi:hypothetical protein
MSSPATIQATHDLMAAKGGAADDIDRLEKGEFYFSTEGFNHPVKIRTSLCLSWHPPNPPTAEEVIRKAHEEPKELDSIAKRHRDRPSGLCSVAVGGGRCRLLD